MAPGSGASAKQDAKDYLFTFPLKSGTASWYAMAAWDQEGTNDPVALVGAREPRDMVGRATDLGLPSQDQFIAAVKDVAARMRTPAIVKFLSTRAEVQSAPLDTLHPVGKRTYKQAIELLQQEIDRTATKWEPVISAASPVSLSNRSGNGFFTEGSNQAGFW